MTRLLQCKLSLISSIEQNYFFGRVQTLSERIEMAKLRKLVQNRNIWEKAVEKFKKAAVSKLNVKERKRLARIAAELNMKN